MASGNAADMQRKSNEYNEYINQEEKPLEFLIHELGDFFRRWEGPTMNEWLKGDAGNQKL